MKKLMVILMMLCVVFSFNCGSVCAAGENTAVVLDSLCIDCPAMAKVWKHTFGNNEVEAIKSFISPADSTNLMAIRHTIDGSGVTFDEHMAIIGWLHSSDPKLTKTYYKLLSIVVVEYKRIFEGEENPFINISCLPDKRYELNGIVLNYFGLRQCFHYLTHYDNIHVVLDGTIDQEQYLTLVNDYRSLHLQKI